MIFLSYSLTGRGFGGNRSEVPSLMSLGGGQDRDHPPSLFDKKFDRDDQSGFDRDAPPSGGRFGQQEEERGGRGGMRGGMNRGRGEYT